MDRDIDAMKDKIATTIAQSSTAAPLQIVPETAAERLARLERRANAMVAKYDAECRQIRLSGTTEPRRSALGDTIVSPFCALGLVVASASMLLNSPDLSLLQLATIDAQLSSVEIDADMLQQKILEPLASARESIMRSHTFEFQPPEGAPGAVAVAKDGVLSVIGGIKSSLAVSLQTAQGIVRNTVGELQTALQNANQALLLATHESQNTFTDAKESVLQQVAATQELIRTKAASVELPSIDTDNVVQQFNTAQDILLAKVKEAQELVRLNAAKVVLPTVDTDNVVQQFNTAQDVLLAKMNEAQELARLNAAKVVLPTVDTDNVVQQFSTAQDAILSKMNEAQELARLNAAKVILPTVDTDNVVQQFNTAQDAILSKMNEAQELARLNAAKVVLPTVDTDNVVQQFSTAQDAILSKMNEAQELARLNAAKVELPKVDADVVFQQVNDVQSRILSQASEIKEAAIAQASAVKLSLPTPVDTLALRQQVNDFYGIQGSSILTKAVGETQEQLVRISAAVSGDGVAQQRLPSLSNMEALLLKVGAGPEMADVLATPVKVATKIIMPKYVF
jgi:hypothetical protein